MKRRSPGTARTVGPKVTPVPKATPVAAVLAAALAGALALSGCQSFSPVQTIAPYQSADGVAVDLGDVQIRDLLVVSSAKGSPGVLSGMVLNNGAEPVTVTFTAGAGGGSAQTQIPAGDQTRLSGVEGATSVTLPAISVAPGAVIKVTVSTPAGGAPEVSVPVLLPEGYYATITPAPGQPTAL